jgi:creatinine amidohydrolase
MKNMRLDFATWPEVDSYLAHSAGILLPVGSTEQHGPIGLIGTDAFCATTIAEAAATREAAYVAPTLAYTPAPFNTAFPGTVSLSEDVFEQVFAEVVTGLQNQGFRFVYVLNAHGANLAPMRRAAENMTNLRIRSWWDFPAVNDIRQSAFGDWEGLHATPSEVSITQACYRHVPVDERARVPPRKLPPDEIARRAGDKHGPPDLHRREFPDGRVGAHSALASKDLGIRLLDAASKSIAEDFNRFCCAT